VQSVAVKNGLVAVAVAVTPEDANGQVALFDTDGTLLNTVEVGNLPDMVTFTPDGGKVLVANEGEPLDETDPLGGVSIIDVSNGAAEAQAVTLDFTGFDGQEDALREAGVLLEPEKSVSEDLEPEYITVLPDGETAWVSLQEANAYAVVDLVNMEVSDIRGFGLVDRSEEGFELDASNDDNAINLQNYDNLFGMRQPDAISAAEIDGTTYIFTANEGDARDATEADIEDLELDPEAFPNADILQQEENLGKLEVRSDLGDTDGDGDYDQLYTGRGRSPSMTRPEKSCSTAGRSSRSWWPKSAPNCSTRTRASSTAGRTTRASSPKRSPWASWKARITPSSGWNVTAA
jgi:alkaline phosphatase